MNANFPRANCLPFPAMDLLLDSDPVASARVEGDALILVLRGEIRRHNSRKFRGTILGLIGTHSPRRLVLNLEQVSFMDSTACAVLIEALRRMRVCNGEICLVAPQPPVMGLLEIARVGFLFAIATTEAEIAGASQSERVGPYLLAASPVPCPGTPGISLMGASA